ncbi:hypothetical protein DPMN_054451 [Dreissena polymorpha]|uniref:Uncharacterized protein n=1 Tax=Dreissena polymorpha TaxID=45954 RepID=A0A9D4CN67_DREPO|nr:hypothetical protein DPMN_054451 [Dreissena polymorpha]
MMSESQGKGMMYINQPLDTTVVPSAVQEELCTSLNDNNVYLCGHTNVLSVHEGIKVSHTSSSS